MRRPLLVLGVAALLLCGWAGFALYRQEASLAPRGMAENMFPGLVPKLREVAQLRIVSQKFGAFDVVFKPEKGWVLPQRGDYPASFAQVRRTINAVATLQTVEPRTARVDWLRYLDLDSPSSGGQGVLITLSDEKGAVLASLIAGKAHEIGDTSGLSGIFVRKPDSTQSWLARGVLKPAPDPAEWMEREVLDLDRARIRQVDVTPAKGTPFAVLRDKPSDADFRLSGSSKSSPNAEAVAVALVGFTFDDIRPARNFDFSGAARLTAHTFDGLRVTAEVTADGGALWARLSAEADPGKPEARKQAEVIAARSAGWAYRLPAFKGRQFMTTRDELLKP